MKKIKVIRIIARLNIGGPAVHAIILNEGLDRNRFDSCLITGVPDASEGDMKYLIDKKANVTFIPKLSRNIRFWSDMTALWKLFKIIRKEKPDIVHTHTAKAGTLGRCAALLNGVPVKVHSFHGHVFHGYFNPTATRMFVLIEKILAMFTDQLIVVSDIIKEDICGHFKIADTTKVSVIKLGLNLDRFKDIGNIKGEFRKELGIERGTPLIGIVGRLTAIKNHRLLFRSIRLLKNESPNLGAKFLIIGDGELREDLESYARDLEINNLVYFVGWRKDMPNIYADLDIVVLTSLNEGTPLSLIEAMVSKKAVVATVVGGVPDLVENKQTGLLVTSNDAAQLKEAISVLLKDEGLRERLGHAAGLYVREKYGKERLVKDMENLYKRLLLKKRPLKHKKGD